MLSRQFWKQSVLEHFFYYHAIEIISTNPKINFMCPALQLHHSCRLQILNSQREALSPSLHNGNL